MTEVMELVTQLTDLIAELDQKVSALEHRVGAVEVSPDPGSKVAELKKQTDQVMMRMSSLDEHIYNQNRNVMQKIDIIAVQISELRRIIYETGLVVVGPEMIDKMEKKLAAEKEKEKTAEPKPTKFGKKRPANKGEPKDFV